MNENPGENPLKNMYESNKESFSDNITFILVVF